MSGTNGVRESTNALIKLHMAYSALFALICLTAMASLGMGIDFSAGKKLLVPISAAYIATCFIYVILFTVISSKTGKWKIQMEKISGESFDTRIKPMIRLTVAPFIIVDAILTLYLAYALMMIFVPELEFLGIISKMLLIIFAIAAVIAVFTGKKSISTLQMLGERAVRIR